MQPETEQNLIFLTRLENLKLAQSWTWEEAARQIGISRTMVHFIKSGKHGVTKKNWHRLEEAEKAYSPSSSEPPVREGIRKDVAAAEDRSKLNICPDDIDKGAVDVPITYRRGSPPAGHPTKVRVTAPPAKAAAQALATIKLDEDFSLLLSACLPKEFTSPEFLNKLTPFAYNALVNASLSLTFGLDWRRMVNKE